MEIYENIDSNYLNNSLIWKETFDILPINLRQRYLDLMNNRYDLKYALRTINILVTMKTREEQIAYYKKDIEEGSWCISSLSTQGTEIDDYFSDLTDEEFYRDLISYCENWE